MNKELKEEINSLQGGMVTQAEKNPLPPGFQVVDVKDSPAVRIINNQNGKHTDCPLFAYGDIRKALYDLID